MAKTKTELKTKSVASHKTAKSAVKKQPLAVSTKTKSQKKPASPLVAQAFDIQGKPQGRVALPKDIFGLKPNPRLLAQAVRVYFNNQSKHAGSTKTRGEVRGGGAKPWRQKGTGRARAGSIRSPLWVGGGVVFGPKSRDVKLDLPKKMRRKALLYALSEKSNSGQIKVLSNLEKIEPKTKNVVNLLKKMEIKGNTLLVISGDNRNVKLASRNIPQVSICDAPNLNAYEIVRNGQILFSKEALQELHEFRTSY